MINMSLLTFLISVLERIYHLVLTEHKPIHLLLHLILFYLWRVSLSLLQFSLLQLLRLDWYRLGRVNIGMLLKPSQQDIVTMNDEIKLLDPLDLFLKLFFWGFTYVIRLTIFIHFKIFRKNVVIIELNEWIAINCYLIIAKWENKTFL